MSKESKAPPELKNPVESSWDKNKDVNSTVYELSNEEKSTLKNLRKDMLLYGGVSFISTAAILRFGAMKIVRRDNRVINMVLPLSFGFLSALVSSTYVAKKHIAYLTEELPPSPFTRDVRTILVKKKGRKRQEDKEEDMGEDMGEEQQM